MDDSQDKPDYFQYRWGVKEWDVGFTTIPNPVLKHYYRVPWVDKDKKRGRGISNQEMLCIVHLASFHYESEEGESRPAIGTVARRMGYKKDDSVRGLIKSLEHKNLLIVERRSGKCSVYNLSNFSRAILELEEEQPPHSNGDHPSGGLSNGGHSSGPHSQGDEEKKVLKERKQEGEEEKKEKETDADFSERKEQPDAVQTGFQGTTGDGIPEAESLGGRDIRDPVPELLSREETRVLPDSGGDSGSGEEAPSPLRFDLSRRTAATRAQSANYAVPAPAGGSFALGDILITAACARLGRSEPEGEKRQQALAFFDKALKAEGLLGNDGDLTVGAVRDWLDPEGDYAFFLPQYAFTIKHELALRHFGIVLSKAKAAHRAQDARRARLAAANEEAQDAVKEKPKLKKPKDCPIGAQVKRELSMQMDKGTYSGYVARTRMVVEDGHLLVTAPDEFVMGWVKDRLGKTIERTLAGIKKGLGVEYEVVS